MIHIWLVVHVHDVYWQNGLLIGGSPFAVEDQEIRNNV